jgi:hypothetical protein
VRRKIVAAVRDMSYTKMSQINEVSTLKSGDFVMPDPEDQQVWNASLGLDLADRSVFEAEVLIWRIVRERSSHSGSR